MTAHTHLSWQLFLRHFCDVWKFMLINKTKNYNINNNDNDEKKYYFKWIYIIYKLLQMFYVANNYYFISIIINTIKH